MTGLVNCFVIGAGASKTPAVARVQGGDTSLPLQQVTTAISNAGGKVTWFIDEAAAEQL